LKEAKEKEQPRGTNPEMEDKGGEGGISGEDPRPLLERPKNSVGTQRPVDPNRAQLPKKKRGLGKEGGFKKKS